MKSTARTNVAFLTVTTLMGIPFIGYGTMSILLGLILLGLLALYLFGRLGKRWLVSARTLHTTLLCMMMIIVGYASYALIVVRSEANTPMDQNSPEDVFSLADYLGREQYGTRPLFYGQAYTSQLNIKVEDGYYVPDVFEGAAVYQQKAKEQADEKDRYFVVRHKLDYNYAQNMLFPRMYSDKHARGYEEWLGGVEGYQVPYDRYGEMQMVKMPTQWENLRFFFSYQINYMYWRYFMWNFVGRQNDRQGEGTFDNGNWITGFSFIDNALYGDQTLLPSDLRENRGRNVFYCLPLLLGIIGLLWQAYKGDRGVKQFWVVFFLFFMTGLAIVIYLNQTPNEPRERDYAFAGSFYAFAIWIGMGVVGLTELLRKRWDGKGLATAVAVACLAVPIQMVSQTWDDHDRSGRYTCRDFGQNYLMSLPETANPSIYTTGANDTFPLWYNVEVEGFRTDVRVCNLSYLQTDWYIDQMRRPAYDSPAVPIEWERYEYESGTNEVIAVQPEYKEAILSYYQRSPSAARRDLGNDPFELKNIMKHWVRNKNAELHFIPTDTVYITIDKEAVRRSGMMIPKELGDSIPDRMAIPLTKGALYKNELMMLEMIANTNWERPIFIAITVGEEYQLGLAPFFLQEGLAYRITPFNFRELGYAQTLRGGYAMDTEKMFDNLMHKFKFGGVEDPNVYLDEVVERMCVTHRRLFAELANHLIAEGEEEKALEVLDYCAKVLPATSLRHDYQSSSLALANSYVTLGETEKGAEILEALGLRSLEYVLWYLSLDDARLAQTVEECLYNFYVWDEVNALLREADTAQTLQIFLEEKFNELYGIYRERSEKIRS